MAVRGLHGNANISLGSGFGVGSLPCFSVFLRERPHPGIVAAA